MALRESLLSYIYENWGKVLGGLIGLVVALLIIVFGFWSGLFIIACVLAGIFLGGRIEKQENLRKIVNIFWYNRDQY